MSIKQKNCRLCRREMKKLFLKGEKCYSPKCPVALRSYPPGEKGALRRQKLSDYGFQLREKQKVKRIYNISETQFKNYFRKSRKGTRGESLLQFLELRLDNIVFSLGLADSRDQARQIVGHGHILVNDKKVNIPSYQVKQDDEITLHPSFQKSKFFKEYLPNKFKLNKPEIPSWLKLDTKTFKGKVLRIPGREELDPSIQEQLIIELYSK